MEKPKLSLEDIRKAERRIGLKASRMIKKSVINEITTLNLGHSSDKPLHKTVRVSPVMGDVRLYRISTSMSRHGFILEHGTTNRTAHTRQIEKTNTFYTVKDHGFLLRRIPFIERAVQNSGAFEYLFEEIGKIRMKEVMFSFMKSDIKVSINGN